MSEEVDYSKHPEADVVVDYIVRRFKKGLYTLTFVWGLPGSGKSSTCQRLGELVSLKLFNENRITNKRIVDNFLDFLRLVKDSKPGDIIIIEEVSVLFPARRAMARDNVNISKILDTCRKRRIIVFSNAPIFKNVDGNIRALANIGIETYKVVKKQQVVISKPLILQTNPGSGKTYLHRFSREGVEVDMMYTRMPNSETWKLYEKDKDDFIDKTYTKLKLQHEQAERKENEKLGIMSPRLQERPLTQLEIKTYDLVERQHMSVQEAANKLGVKHPVVSARMRNINKKLLIMGKAQKETTTNVMRANLSSMDNPEKLVPPEEDE